MRTIRPRRPGKLVVRYETTPGEQSQCDWGYCGHYEDSSGDRHRVYVFILILSFSRFMYVQLTTGMHLKTLMECHQKAFDYCGGWTRSILYDNMKQVRLDGRTLNTEFVDFCDHYGIVPRTHRPYRPQTKGKVEGMVHYLKDNFLNGRRFADLQDLNTQSRVWLEEKANRRIQETTGKRPCDLLDQEKLTPNSTICQYQWVHREPRVVTAEALAQLGLSIACHQLDTTAQKAAANQWSYSHFLGYLLEAELKGRHGRLVAMSTRFAHFPYLKTLEDFDFKAQPSIDPKLIEELATLRFLSEGRNVVLLGPLGVGKTHLAIALVIQAIQGAQRAYFINAMDMARKLDEAMQRNHLPRLIKNMTKIKILVIDEVGYLELSKAQASLLFQIISLRYEAKLPIILTSNKAFGNWASVFAGDHVMASAAPDRLLHKSTIIS